MPVLIQSPTGSVAEGFLPTLTQNYTLVADESDSTFVYASYAPGTEDRLSFPALPADASSINEVRFILRIAADLETFTCRVKMWLGGNTGVGAIRTMTATITSHVGVALSKPGGGSWAVSDVNSLDAGYELLSGSAFSQARVYRLLRVVDYNATTPAPTRRAETVLLPADQGRDVTLPGSVSVDLPDDGNRSVNLPTASALDIESGWGTQPTVELEEEGF